MDVLRARLDADEDDLAAVLLAGFGVVGTKERKDCANFQECATRDRDAPTMESKMKLAPTWGLGFNFYMSKAVALGKAFGIPTPASDAVHAAVKLHRMGRATG